VAANKDFMEQMQILEVKFASRNVDPAAWSRYGGEMWD
jgi:hypothetical protein